jgi:16S rRNA (guanine527-N7)-methyltransferase
VNLPVPPNPLPRSADADERLRRWLHDLLSTPGLTSIRDPEEAWRFHVEDSLAAAELVRGFPGDIVDVGSGGGAPGVPIAAAFPDRLVTLLEASGRKCEFLAAAARDFPNVRVVHGRAEEQPVDTFGVALAKALAPPVVAAEWCLPLVTPGGAAILYTGSDVGRLGLVAERLGGMPPEIHAVREARARRLVVLRKSTPTPLGFPRRPGMARKRPLA